MNILETKGLFHDFSGLQVLSNVNLQTQVNVFLDNISARMANGSFDQFADVISREARALTPKQFECLMNAALNAFGQFTTTDLGGTAHSVPKTGKAGPVEMAR